MPSKGQCRTPLQELRAFWKKVDCSGDECWEWQGATAGIGYGAWFPGGKHVPAHRYSYLKTYGVDPGELLVCHKCDNPACVRPDHLFLGTNQDNADDRVRKGRGKLRGRGPVLSREDVLRIGRHCVETGDGSWRAAKALGLPWSAVNNVVAKKTWESKVTD